MSVRVIDMMAPVALGEFLQEVYATFPISTAFEGHGSIYPFIEAAPHYTGIRLKMTIEGVIVSPPYEVTWMDHTVNPAVERTYTETVTSTYSYTKEVSLSRVPLLTGMTGEGLRASGDFQSYWPTETYAEGTGTPIDFEVNCTMRIAAPPQAGTFKYSPIWQVLEIMGGWQSPSTYWYGEEVVGETTYAYTGELPDDFTPTPTADIVEQVDLWPPSFFHMGAASAPLECPYNRWGRDQFGIPTGDWMVDISAWTEANWRDLRGIHTFSAEDENGITRTYEWEIL